MLLLVVDPVNSTIECAWDFRDIGLHCKMVAVLALLEHCCVYHSLAAQKLKIK
jgi:hypothetical protein